MVRVSTGAGFDPGNQLQNVVVCEVLYTLPHHWVTPCSQGLLVEVGVAGVRTEVRVKTRVRSRFRTRVRDLLAMARAVENTEHQLLFILLFGLTLLLLLVG